MLTHTSQGPSNSNNLLGKCPQDYQIFQSCLNKSLGIWTVNQVINPKKEDSLHHWKHIEKELCESFSKKGTSETAHTDTQSSYSFFPVST